MLATMSKLAGRPYHGGFRQGLGSPSRRGSPAHPQNHPRQSGEVQAAGDPPIGSESLAETVVWTVEGRSVGLGTIWGALLDGREYLKGCLVHYEVRSSQFRLGLSRYHWQNQAHANSPAPVDQK